MATGAVLHPVPGRGYPTVHVNDRATPQADATQGSYEAMAEVGIDITGEYPKPWTDEVVRAADVIITMGCGDACPIFPGIRYESWELDDPAGKTVADIRPIRNEIERRVRQLLNEMAVPTA
nr:heat-shock protein HtpX [Allorhizocola rhizosphaerae]